jgi:hypothetical protein
MKVTKFLEAGFEPALYGFALSYKKPGVSREEFWTSERRERAYKAALANAHRDGGHNKFLEHIMVWITVEANLEWWKQFDTYRIGVSKQSASTMHTLESKIVEIEHFDVFKSEFKSEEDFETYIQYIKMLSNQDARLKSKLLPQAYIQEREIVLSYKVIRHCIKQRYSHKLPAWQMFICQLVKSLDRKEFLGKDVNELLG